MEPYQDIFLHPWKYILNFNQIELHKASVTIVAGFCPEFHPPFLWRSKHQTKNDCSYQ